VIHEGPGLLVDPSYFWFGASHKKFEYLDDLRATASFLSQFPDFHRKQIAAKLAPADPWVQTSYLFDLISGNRWEDARLIREKVRSLRPDSWMVVLADGLFAWRAGDSAEALQLLNRAGEINPDESEIDIQLAQMFVKMNRFEAARERYLQALMKADGKSETDKALAALAELSALAARKSGAPPGN
jgi:Flp pilus assembly protein TadD